MGAAVGGGGVSAAQGFLEQGDWERASEAFNAVLDDGESAEALDGLARASWWLGRASEALSLRERAYAAFRRKGEMAAAARTALWLAREFWAIQRNEPVASGWLARAGRLIDELPAGPEHGWLALARSERASRTTEAVRNAEEALAVAARHHDPDLEIRSLARLGLAYVSAGRLEEGLTRLDEAMAAATSGEPTSPETTAETCCDMIVGTQLVGDPERFRKWMRLVEGFMQSRTHGPMLAFCGVCCAEMHLASGNLREAEQELAMAMRALEEAGQRARCVHPAARLAELSVLQGRYEEAERLLEGYEDLPETVGPRVELALARGETAVAAALLERRLNAIGPDSLLSVPYLARLVDVRLTKGDTASAREASDRLTRLAEASGHLRAGAEARWATARVEFADGRVARTNLEGVVEEFTRLGMPLEAARAQLRLAELVADEAPEVALAEARTAQAAFESVGAVRDGDAAAALLRRLGGGGRTGPKSVGKLSRREEEVLALLAEGLTNTEVADRLFISPKTAGHHVSSILAKLGLRSRAEAAVYAQRKGRSGSL